MLLWFVDLPTAFVNFLGGLWLWDSVYVELGRIVERWTVEADTVEQIWAFLDGSMEDNSTGAHQDDVGEEMEDVGCWLMDGEQNDARRRQMLLEEFRFAGNPG